MSSERWNQINELFHAALERDPQQRNAFLKSACGSDTALEKEVQSLLNAHNEAGDFIQTPVKNVLDVLEEEEQLRIGQQIGAYKIIREIGRGGMGAVYLAERADHQYEKYVALKLVKRGMDTDYVLRHFRNERQILANFDHPNIARLLDGGSTESGLPYFVMEFVEGTPIDQYCDSHQLSITRRLELFRNVCGAVSYAHRNMVIHRDIKPSNILVTTEGVPKLLDFGIAKILQDETGNEATATAMRIMTPEYASPEQALGFPSTTLSDVYSLGVVLYELITGYSPYRFASRSAMDMMRVITETEPMVPSSLINRGAHLQTADQPTPETVSKIREGSPDRLKRRLIGDIDNVVLMALRKEPERRYQSVEQFTEDIGRHLSGLPVVARKSTLTYRSTKFVRRNKLAVATATFAIAALLVSAVIAGVIQWRANQRARFLQEFGQEAARMEGIMRFAYLLPLHDVTTERKLVEDRIETIRARTSKLGDAAAGPGYYAIGRGWMALREYQNAKKHFEIALNQHAYNTPEVAYSYGLTLAMVYEIEMESAARITNEEQRKTRLKEIQTEYKFPALHFIQQGRQSSEYSDYAAALVEFLDERLDNAIARSKQATQKLPWLYEAAKLEGDSYALKGRQFLNSGKHTEALDAFTQAEAAYAKSIQKGNSDPSGYVGLCKLKTSILDLRIQKGDPIDATYEMGQMECQKALSADPRNVEALLALTSIHNQWVRGHYPKEGTISALEKAIPAAREATRLQPDNAKTHKALGQTYFWLADYQFLKQTDPTKAISNADQSLEKAIQLNPNDGDAYYSRGQLFQTLAQYSLGHGQNPKKALDQSDQFLKEAVRLNPKSIKPLISQGSVLTTRAEYESGNGMKASTSFDSAIVAFKQAMKINPDYYSVHVNLGYTSLAKAEYQFTVGQNPSGALQQAQESYTKALQIRPKDTYSMRGLAQATWRVSEFTVTTNNNPVSTLKDAQEQLERIWAIDKSDWGTYSIRGEMDLVAGRWKMLQGESPVHEFRTALEWFNRVEEIGGTPEIFELWYSRARIYRWWAEWNLLSKSSCAKEVDLGLQMISRALKINPRSAEMIGSRGIFCLFQARSAASKDQRLASAERAKASLIEAIHTNANVTRMLDPFLKEAETILAARLKNQTR